MRPLGLEEVTSETDDKNPPSGTTAASGKQKSVNHASALHPAHRQHIMLPYLKGSHEVEIEIDF